MARQVWGTYAVNDHCASRAFISDVILYDRLVIPVPPDADRDYWQEQGWDPARQNRILQILGDRAYKVVWDQARRERWKTRYVAGSDLAHDLGDWAFMATRTELTHNLPRHITGVEAVPTYRSYDELTRDLHIAPSDPPVEMYGATAAAIVGHEFLAPDDPDWSYDDLLKEAVKLSSKPIYRHKRASFWRWHREFLNDKGITDQAAIKAAVDEMRILIKEEQAYIRRFKIRTAIQFAFLVGSVTLGLLGGPLTAIGIGGAFVSVGQFAVERFVKDERAGEPPPVALLHDTQKHFGWN